MLDTRSDYFELFAKCTSLNGQPMSWHEAVDFMQELKSLASLNLEHQEDGCVERCLLIMRLLQQRGLQSGAIKIEGVQERFILPEHLEPFNYHYAAYAVIDTRQKIVFDPLLSEPMVKTAWIDKMCNAGADRKSFTEGEGLDVFAVTPRDWRAAQSYMNNIQAPAPNDYFA